MIVFDRDGNFLRSWGEGVFPRAHGVYVAPDETLWLTDDGDHTVRQCTLEGKVLLTLGTSGKPAPYMSGEPFHRCTHTAMSPNGDIYVSDGYGNARGPQIRAGRQAAAVLGRARHRPRRVQHRAQHHLRCRRLGLCRRPRKSSRPGVRRQRQIRNAVEQPAPPLRSVHAARQMPDLLHRRTGSGAAGQPRCAEPRPARHHRRQHRQAPLPTGWAWGRALVSTSSWRRTA